MTNFTALERRAVISLSGIYALRILGLFMMLPIFSLYATQLVEATPTRIGLALGIYGLTQAIFQIPLGYLSDRWGRKPLIIIGLLLFFLGSVVAAISNSITGVILGRALQGMGAIGGVVMALLADVTRETVRLRAMASIGLTIGLSFGLSFILGPLLAAWGGLSSIFWITAGLALLATGLVIFIIPSLPAQGSQRSSFKSHTSTTLFISYLGVFILHASLAALFLKIPEAITQFLPENTLWQFYCPILFASLLSTLPIILFLEKSLSDLPLFFIILGLMLSELGMLVFFHSFTGLSIFLWLFFTSFNSLEAYLPTLISKQTPPEQKGKTMGIFSTLQFLGIFVGGVVGGSLNSLGGLIAVLGFCVILAFTWLVVVGFFQLAKRG